MEEGTLRLGHGPEEPNHDDKRMTHNMVEKRRKDRIKQWISHIAQLLPPASSQGPDKPSTLDIMERAANYIIELKASYEKLLTEQGDAVLVEEMHKMRTELDQVRAERDRLAEVLNAAGIAALNDTSQWRGSRKSTSNLTENGSSPAAAVVDAVGEVAAANGGSDESRSKNKSNVSSSSKRRNTISVHLEQQKLQQEQQQQQQQQAMAQAMASGLLPHNGGLIYGQNLMVNPNLMVSPTGQVVVSGSHQTVTPGSVSSATISALDGSQRDTTVYGLEKNTQSGIRGVNANVLGGGSIGGLLQIAMQDAGITPSLQLDASRQSSPAPVSELTVHSDSAPPDSDVSRTHAPQQSLSLEDVGHDALQTLASVASNTVSSSMSLFPSLASSVMMGMMTGSASLAASTVTVTSSSMNQNTPIMSVGQLSQLQQQHQQPSQASLMMGMPVLNPLAPNAGLGMVAPNAGQNPGAMGIMPSGAIGQHGQLSMIQGAAGPGGLVPGSILMNQQGQLLVINENGIPILMQQPLDPSIAGLSDKTVIGAGGVSVSTNSGLMGGGNPTISLFDHQQQALIGSGALTITKSDPNGPGGLGSASVSHPQSSILAGMNPQTAGQMNFLGSQILPQGALQSLAVQSGGQLGSLLQPGATVNQQLMQSLGISFPGMLTGAAAGGGMSANPANQAPHGITGNPAASAAAAAGGPAAASSVLFPGGQAGGMVTLNTVPTNPHQLPSALVLPTGHVIPVVSNPQLLTTAHGGGGLMSMAPGGGGGLNNTSAGATSHIQLQQMGGGTGTSQVIQVDPNNPAGAQVFIGPNGLQMTTTPAGQAHLTQQQQIQQLLQQQNLNILMPSAAISASQTIPTTTVVTLASTVVPASAAKNVLAKAQMQTTQVLMQRNASQTRSHTTSAAIARKGSQTVKTSTSETQTSASSAGLLVQTGCSGTSAGSTGNVQVNSVASNSCNPGANSNSAGAGSAPVLLMMQHNGQLLNVLVDPVTLQVLNSGQTAVQTTQSVGAVVSNPSGDKSTTNSSVHTSVTTSGSKKSSKKSGSQRTATPKPKSSKASVKASSASATPTTTSSCSQTVMSRTNASCSVTASVTQPLVINTDGSWDGQAGSNIMICDETNNPAADDGALAPSSDNQDILAKAAQSIFTASPTEMTSPIGGAFYNPAHDDNPLLIDTSPAGPDTDMPSSSSPKKSISAASAAAQNELSKSVDCQQQQQQQQHSQMLREQEAMLRQQEQQEQEKLMQQEREQHEQLMRHIEQHQHQMGLGSPETLSLIPPSMPSLTTSDVRASLSAGVSVAVGESCAAAVNVTPAAAQLIPPPKKPKKSKSKKKDKEKEDCREKDADSSKSSKKSSKKKKKEQEAAIRRQEEINQQQQQLILQQQQQQQQEEQAKLQQQQHEQEQLLLLQQHQQQQEQESPGLMSEPQLVQPSATDMMVDDVPDHVVSGAADPFVLPDSITFTESEISDVLDQVEKLGSSLVSDEQLKKYEKVDKPEKRDKKSKRRKDGQMDDSSSNPNKKQCKEPNRESDSTIDANLFVLNQQLGVRPLSQLQQQEDPNSSSRMSIYDFQDDSPPGLGAAKTESPTKSKNKKSKSKAPANAQNLLAATSPLSGSAISSAATVVTITATVTTTSTTTTSAGTNTPASSLDLLVPALSQAKSDASSSASKGSKSSKSKKSDKKDRTKASNASTMANSLNNMNAVNSANSMNAAARVNSAATDSMSIQTNGTISSSKSNDSLSSNSVDSASVILPMPGFDTLEALNSPPPLISPPVSQSKSAAPSSGSKDQGQGQLQGQSMDGSLGQISSIVSSDIVTTMCSTSIETLADISDVVPTSNTMSIDPLMLPGANSPPPALHHPMTLSHNNTNSLMVQQQQQQQQKQKQHQQQQQQNISNKQRQQTPPRHSSSQQMPSHSPQISQSSQSGPSQGHAHMGPPTSPAQAVGRPRSTSLSHQQQQNQTGGFLSSSPQGGGGVRQSPSASCISPSSSHSRGSHENQGFGQAAGAHLAPTQSPSSSSRLGDMAGLISPDISCPNANLFNSPAPKLSHMQKSASQGKPSCTEDSAASRSRTGIYSADNFVQPSRQTSNLESCSQQSSNNAVPGNMSRMPGINDANGESFNFTSIGLNLTSSSTQSTGQEMGVASSAGMPFSFSLTSASTTQTSSSSGSHGQVGHPSFPFYPLHPSVTQPSGTSQQSHQTQSLSMMPPGVDHRMDGQPGHQTSGPGVGAGAMSSTGQNGFNFGGLMDLNSSCSGGRDTAMPGDQSHLLSSVDKSPMGGFTQHHGGGGAGGGSGTNSGQKRLSEIQPPPPPSNRPPQQPTQPLDHGPPINRSPQQMGNHTSPAGNYFTSSYPSSASLNTPPLRHPPLPNTDSNHLMNRGFDHGFGASQTSTSVPLGGPSFDHHGMSYPRDMNQTRPLEHVSAGASTSSRKPSSQSQQQQNGGGSKQQKQSQSGGGGSGGINRVPPSHNQSANMPPSQTSTHGSSQSQQNSATSQAPPPAHQTSGNGQPPAPSPSQQARQAKRKQPSSQSKKSKPTYSTEIDANLSHSIFDNNQSLQSFFSFQNMSPPPVRNLQSEGPSFLPGNLFGSTSRPLSNSSNKNTPDLGPPYALFPPTRPQNGLGLNFQHSFGMNTMTGNPGSGHMTPHSVAVPPHMGNFSLSNIFSDGGTNDGGINISPIKFSHPGNPILPPQAGMDPNALQHPHQGTALYHNRSHHGQPHVLPNPMTLNSILGHNHHGFDTRSMGQGINSSVGPPFHGAGHPSSFAIPPLNFSMHDH